MEKENPALFNSPLIHKLTPIKRLGLSRKRKRCGSECSLSPKVQACQASSEKSLEGFLAKDSVDEDNNPEINYDKEIKLLEKRIAESEEKLKAIKCSKSNIIQLEDLIEQWKNGCKNAFLHFSQLLRERQVENINFKDLLSKLGVWETMVENFENDSDMSLSEYSQ